MARSLKNILTAGTDEIPEFVVKQCIEQLKVPLANIYNASLESGTSPDKLKIAKVTPTHKKGDLRDVSNYRPISVLPLFSKLLENLMYKRLTAFIDRSKVLTEAQHGFRTKKNVRKRLYRKTPKHLYPKLNGLGDNGQ